jgi:hypothetical protein
MNITSLKIISPATKAHNFMIISTVQNQGGEPIFKQPGAPDSVAEFLQPSKAFTPTMAFLLSYFG